MARAKAIEATAKHVGDMFGRIRQEDQDECYAALGRSAEEGLMQSFSYSGMRWAVVSDAGDTIAIYGCARPSVLGGVGIPWLVGTDRISEFKTSFARGGRRYVRKMLDRFSYLENWVDVRNTLAIKWLKWIGFEFEEPKVYGFEMRPFHRFWMRRGE